MSRPASTANQEPRSKATRRRPPMTVAQLERKRAGDRLSQRATRARTQQYIQRLEQEVQELRVMTAPESRNVDGNTLQELHLRNQALTDELARLRGLAAGLGAASAIPQVTSGMPEATPLAPFDPPLEHEMQPQSQAFSPYMYSGEGSALSVQQLSVTSNVPNVQPAHSYHITADQPQEWLAPDLGSGNTAINFGLSGSSLTSQPALGTPSYCQSCNSQHTTGLIQCQTPTRDGQHDRLLRNEFASDASQQVDYFQFRTDPPPRAAPDAKDQS
ncbi:bZIP transcription factor domain-containing protein [Pochonia chlamydosporia 170]|uniref:BZIP transcription factor domain-containing protein n=1 Tax=Pochonia chlamydosporia 170 TaxID=1380566 RepID=A0A179EY80_METCM|nr:bZIP transcription factor domain-containing protein [Pochonia chlamydosporia 170]OAQ57859.1 bZIP transcription factor domain-containing protein [Pochonia chlamydosporia 170]